MTKFFFKFKKPYFWSILPILGAKKAFLENPALSRATSYQFLAPCQNLEKTNDTIPRKRPDGRTDGRKQPISKDLSGYRQGSNKQNIKAPQRKLKGKLKIC